MKKTSPIRYLTPVLAFAHALAFASEASTPVEILSVASANRPVTEEVVGSVRTRVRSVIEAKVSGRISEMPVKLGQKIQSGELLAKIDAREVQARLEQAEAQSEQAGRDLDRIRTLAEKQVASKQELESAESRARVAEASVREARAMLEYSNVTAPFDGVISRRLAEVGDLAAPGKPLLEIEDRGELRFEADIPEALIGMVNSGDRLEVTIPTLQKSFSAVVAEVSPTADATSRTFLVKLDLPASPDLRAGQFGRAAVPVGEAKSLRIPAAAIIQRGQLEIVFVNDSGKARLRLVRTGKTFSDGVEILSGLSEGDSVILTNPGALVDGQPVEVTK
jgi:RND family efflux transporter MFP subunit